MMSMACLTMGAAPRRPVDVPFGRNYMPTWAFDHIKYFNGGSEIQLHLDKYTGMLLFLQSFSLVTLVVWCIYIDVDFELEKVPVSNRKGHTCLVTSVCKSNWFQEILPEQSLLSM